MGAGEQCDSERAVGGEGFGNLGSGPLLSFVVQLTEVAVQVLIRVPEQSQVGDHEPAGLAIVSLRILDVVQAVNQDLRARKGVGGKGATTAERKQCKHIRDGQLDVPPELLLSAIPTP